MEISPMEINYVPRRVSFPPQIRETLFDIIYNREGGRFLKALQNKDHSKNMQKAEVWTIITALFNEVPTSYTVNVCKHLKMEGEKAERPLLLCSSFGLCNPQNLKGNL
jgi:hypothetical protein